VNCPAFVACLSDPLLLTSVAATRVFLIVQEILLEKQQHAGQFGCCQVNFSSQEYYMKFQLLE
jgi:hypothetical protein